MHRRVLYCIVVYSIALYCVRFYLLFHDTWHYMTLLHYIHCCALHHMQALETDQAACMTKRIDFWKQPMIHQGPKFCKRIPWFSTTSPRKRRMHRKLPALLHANFWSGKNWSPTRCLFQVPTWCSPVGVELYGHNSNIWDVYWMSCWCFPQGV